MTTPSSRCLPALLIACLSGIGCSSGQRPIEAGGVSHIVLFTLARQQDADELERDCARLLRPIESVRVYACGNHVDTGRSIVRDDYDVGLYVSFEDEAGYQAYLDDPDHLALVSKWKDRWTDIVLYDFGDE